MSRPTVLPIFTSASIPTSFSFLFSVLNPSLSRPSFRLFGNALTSTHLETFSELAFSAPAAHGAPGAYNPPALALYPHASEVGPEFV